MACSEKKDFVTVTGKNGTSMGIDVSNVAPSCEAGGITVKTFVDANSDAVLNSDEVVKSNSVVCNGTNGQDGESLAVRVASEEECANGGIVLNEETPICNGTNGLNGSNGNNGNDGKDGKDGKDGIDGTNGVGNVTPIQLCPGDTAAFKEYGLIINNQLYAVYHNNSAGHTFLAQLSPGSYVTTNGSNCHFTYGNDGTNITINNNIVTNNTSGAGLRCDVYDINSWSSSTRLPDLFVGSALKGTYNMARINVPNSPSSAGFPGMPASIQNLVGLEGYALDCAGYLTVPTSGDYQFKLLSDDGSELRINDALIIDNQGLHAPTSVTSSVVRLNKGLNRINVVYYQGPHSQIALELKMKGPNFVEQVVPANLLSH